MNLNLDHDNISSLPNFWRSGVILAPRRSRVDVGEGVDRFDAGLNVDDRPGPDHDDLVVAVATHEQVRVAVAVKVEPSRQRVPERLRWLDYVQIFWPDDLFPEREKSKISH